MPNRMVQFQSSIRENVMMRGMGVMGKDASQASLGLNAISSRGMVSMEVPRACLRMRSPRELLAGRARA